MTSARVPLSRRELLTWLGAGAIGGLASMDLASVIGAAGTSGGSAMRIATVTAYNPGTGALTISYAGTTLAGVAYNPAYLPAVGDTVAVMNSGPTWYVMGSTVSSTPRFFPVSQRIATAETCASVSFVDLATVGPSVTVTVGASGKAKITWGCSMQFNANNGGVMGIQVTGATSIAPDWRIFAAANSAGGAWNIGGSRTEMYSLNPGVNTITAKYTLGGGTPTSCTFLDRTVMVETY